VFCHTERLRDHPARLKLVLSDSAGTIPKKHSLYFWRNAEKVRNLLPLYEGRPTELIRNYA
jgi:hypothetical protein